MDGSSTESFDASEKVIEPGIMPCEDPVGPAKKMTEL
jgi:hypothetical protein